MGARKLLGVYALLSAVGYAATVLPPHQASFEGDGAIWWPIITAALVIFIWRGSSLVWFLAVLFHVFMVLSVFFAAAVEFDLVVIWASQVGGLMVLLSRPVRDLVWQPRELRVAA